MDLRAGDVDLRISSIVDSVLTVLLHGFAVPVILPSCFARKRQLPHSAAHAKDLHSVAAMAVTIAVSKLRMQRSVIVIPLGGATQNLEACVRDV